MTKIMDEAIDAWRSLPPELQGEIAPVVLVLAGKDQPVYSLTPEEAADIDEGIAELERGDVATDEDIRAIWSKHGL